MNIPDLRAGKAKNSTESAIGSRPTRTSGWIQRAAARARRRARRNHRTDRVIKPIDIAEHCVLCFFQEVIREVAHGGAQARQIHNGESEAGDYPVYELDYGGRRLAVVHPGVGAPNAAARWNADRAGCRKFIACGGAGVLVESIDVGRIVVPTSAVRDEGTSYHYLPPSREVAPTRRALAAIKAVLRENHHDYISGKTWTTDAVYRGDAAADGAAAARGLCRGRSGGGCVFRRRTFPPGRVRATPVRRRHPQPVGDGLRADGTVNAARERLFHLAAEACLRL